jgi:hypothetical protein
MIDTKTIVIHCRELTERKSLASNQLEWFGFKDFSFFEGFDPSDLDAKTITELYRPYFVDSEAWLERVSLWGGKTKFLHSKTCNINEVSLTIKIGKALQRLAKQRFKECLVLEDDFILCDQFEEKLEFYLSQTPNDWEAIYLAECFGLHHPETRAGQFAYPKDHPASRGCAAILLKKKTVEDLARTWFPFSLVSDWEMSYQHFLHGHKVYWWEPTLVKQGSESGLYKSSLGRPVPRRKFLTPDSSRDIILAS